MPSRDEKSFPPCAYTPYAEAHTLRMPLRIHPGMPLRICPRMPLRIYHHMPLRIYPRMPLRIYPHMPLRIGPVCRGASFLAKNA